MNMYTLEKTTEINLLSLNLQKNGKIIGFVPTMGALHEGHISLLNRAKRECDIVVVSIFVNPTQFNDKEDLKNYPRNLSNDTEKLEKAGCDVLFIPSEKEIYPEKINKSYDFGILDKVMEGKYRPGHFKGVAMVVERLFEIVKPQRAYFGEKDFQQLAVINALVSQLNLNIEIIACPIVRETNGLAMSSRNKLMNGTERRIATAISGALFKALDISAFRMLSEVKDFVKNEIERHPRLKLEYFEIVDADSLKKLKKWKDSNKPVGCIAVKIGKIRLIDNIRFYS